MKELESSLHLFQPPLYRAADGSWHRSFFESVECSGNELTWDSAAALSILSFNYVCGDRTLLREIRRRPWLAEIGPDGKPVLRKIPPHDTLWKKPAAIAREFGRLVCDELARVCEGRQHLYVLLSGGLDSRVVACMLAKLYRQRRLAAKPIAVTWGARDSRDLAYGRAAADILGLEWIHLELDADHLIGNIEDTAMLLGSMVSPIHLHRMSWFKNVSADALVLVGSYGDMVGRAEFSGKRVLELRPLRAMNMFGLLNPEVLDSAAKDLKADFKALNDRSAEQSPYILREHEMSGHYMRGLISHASSVINNYCSAYQAFTDPSVYSFMWSLHPFLRFDATYAILLEQSEPKLARLPWARTNRALKGSTEGARTSLRREFHNYNAWISGPLQATFRDFVEPDWFEATGLFDGQSVRKLCGMVAGTASTDVQLHGSAPFEMWVWLACFRMLAERLGKTGKRIRPNNTLEPPSNSGVLRVPERRVGMLRRRLRSQPLLYGSVAWIRRKALKYWALMRYPPRRGDRDGVIAT